MNIFSNIPDTLPEELFEDVAPEATGVRIERIVSQAHASPPGFWYDQEKSEWVMVLAGSAGLSFEGSDDVMVLKPGDYVNIPARTRHRVEWTDPHEKTVWLAVHY